MHRLVCQDLLGLIQSLGQVTKYIQANKTDAQSKIVKLQKS